MLVAAGVGLSAFAPSAMAGSIINCGNAINSYASFSAAQAGAWTNTQQAATCFSGSSSLGTGVVLSENGNYFSPDGTNAAILVGASGSNATGKVTIYGPSGIAMMNQVDMTSHKIVNVAAGTVSSISGDAINGSQLYAVSASAASAIGGGSTVSSTGAISAPSYALTNANSIDGTTGAKTDIGTAFGTVDTALGKLNTSITNINNGQGTRYFKVTGNNDGTDDAKAGASTSSYGSIAIGPKALSWASGTATNDAIAIGDSAYATYIGDTAIGGFATAGGGSSTAIGYGASTLNAVSTNNMVALGTSASAGATNSTALGSNSLTSGAGAVTVGYLATATTSNSVALGSNSVANSATLTTAGFTPVGGTAISAATAPGGEVSVGSAGAERRITNVAAGFNPTDAVNVSQLQSEDAKVNNVSSNVSNVANNLANTNNNVANLSGNVTNINNTMNNIVNGGGIKYFHTNSTLADSSAVGVDSVAVGPNAVARGAGSIAIGRNASMQSGMLMDGAIAIGDGSYTGYSQDMAIGQNATAGGGLSIAIGTQASTAGGTGVNNQLAVGTGATSGAANGTALGGSSTAATVNSVALGYNSVANSATLTTAGFTPVGGTAISAATAVGGEVSVGAAGKERRITNVAAGLNATDAVNVSQLQSEDAKVNNVSNNVSNVANNLSNTNNNVANLSGNVTNINNTVNNIVNGGGIKYFHANSTLADASATGSNSVAAGPVAVASGASSTAMGWGSLASATNSSAFGESATAAAYDSVAVGEGATSTVSGTTSNTNGWGVAIGGNANAGAHAAVAVGPHANATASEAIAIGDYSSATAINTVALGQGASAATVNSVALGAGAVANSATLTTAGFTPVGGTAISAATAAGGEVSVGAAGAERRITNVAAGLNATDAVNVSQLQSEDAKVNNVSNNVSNVANNLSNTNNNVANLSGNVTNINNTVNNIVNGGGIKYFHANSTLADSSATGTNAVAIGGAASATTANSVALGSNSVANSATLATAGFTPTGGTAISAGTAAGGEVSVGKAGAERRITNVAAGLSATDAVNVSQLQSEDAKVNNVSNNLSNTNNNVANLSGNVTNMNNTVNNIVNGGGVKYFHANSTLADSSATGTNAVAIGGAASATTANSVALGSNSVANSATLATAGFTPVGGTAISAATAAGGEVSVGAAGAERRITNVAAGLNATDAVNVSQLQSEDAKVNNVSNNVSNVANNLANTNNNVANLSGNVTNINNTVNNIVNGGGIKYFHANSTLADSSATGTNAVAIGGAASATTANSVALGSNSVANSATLATAGFTPTGGTAISAGTAAGGEVSVGKAGAERRITNVAAGLSATDAVNVSQLQSEDAKVNNVSNNLSNTNNNVANLSGNVTNINNTVNNIVNGGGVKYFHANSTLADSSATGTDAVAIGGAASATTANSVALGSNSVANSATLATAGFTPVGGTAISAATAAGGEVSVGAAGAERRMTNVAAGLNATDAVNVSQLQSEDAKVNNVSNNVSNVANNVSNTNNNVANLSGNVTNINNTVNNIVNGGGIKYFHANSTLADSSATGTNAVAIGGAASATTANSVALGSNSVANSATLATAGFTPTGGTAISAGTAAGGEVSVGKAGAERRITNVAAGLSATDAVNVSQLQSEDAKVNNVSNNLSNTNNNVANLSGNVTNINNTVNNIVNGGGVKYFHANSTLADSSATGTDAVAIGGNAQATTANSVALGSNSVANSATLTTAGFTPVGGTAISAATAAGGEVSVGAAGKERRITNVAAGLNATDAVNVSQLQSEDAKVNTVNNNLNNLSNTVNNITNGAGTKYFHANSTLVDSSAVGTNAVAIGGAATATTANSVALGSNSVANSATLATAGFTPVGGTAISAATAAGGEVSVGAAGAERRITNVAAGLNATDAVNVSQLQSEDAKVNNVSNNLSNLAGNVTNMNNTVNNIVNGGGVKYFHANSTLADSSAVGTDAVAIGGAASATTANSVALGSNSVANSATLATAGFTPVGGTAIAAATAAGGEVSVGAAGKERRITNVAAGLNATDAVNVSQLQSEDAKVNNVSNNVSNVANNLSNTNNNVANLSGNVTNINNTVNNIVNGGGIKYFHANSTLADSSATGTDAVAIGGNAQATTANSVALGSNSVANSATLATAGFTPVGGTAIAAATAAGGEVSVGKAGAERRITNVAAGLNATDAVNVSQLQSEDAKVNNVSNNVSNVANNLSNTNNNVANLSGNVTNINNTVNNIVNGGGIKYFHANSTLADSSATGTDAVAIGGAASATTANSVALGSNSVANSATLATAGFTPVGGTAIAAATAAGGEVSVGKAGAERRITNVAAGLNATDAVNVSQLQSEDAKVNNVSNNVSNVANNLANTNNNVANLSGNVTNINNTMNNIVNGGGIKYFHANSTLADSSATGTDAVAIGGNAQATTANSVALGSNSVANSSTLTTAGFTPVGGTAIAAATAAGGEVSVGKAGAERRITNVAAGLNATDAVNVSQLQSEDAKVNNVSNNVSNVANNLANTNNNVANLSGNVTNINNTVNNIVNGGGIKYFHANTALADSSAVGTNAVAIGGNAQATTANSVALGSNSVANSSTLATAGFNPGGSAISAATAAGEVSVGAAGAERRITNVAAGLNATDAVNVSQLMSEDAKVNQIGASTASSLGGGSTYDSTTGAITAPTYTVGGTTVNTVGDAITNIDGRTTQNTTNIDSLTQNIANGSVGLVQQDPTSRNITVAKDTDGTVVDFTGTAGTRTLTGVTAGDLSASSTDAVNGSQLYATNMNVSNVANNLSNTNNNVANLAGNVTNINNTVNNIVNGGGIKYFHANSTLADSSATGTDAVAIGGNAQATAANSVALGSNSVANSTTLTTAGFNPGGSAISAATAAGEVSVGAAGAERRITNVAAGLNATDAVNVSQLMSEDAKVNQIGTSTASSLGGGSTYDSTTGAITAPTYSVGGTTVNTVGDAITNIDGRTTQNTTNIDNLTQNIANGSVGLVQQDPTSRNITVAKDTDGTVVDFTGTAGSRTLTGVAAGAVNATSVDAVNGSQLYGVSQSAADALGGGSTVNSDGTISAPTYSVGGTTVNSVGDAITNIDGRVTQNTSDITNINNTLNNITSGGTGIKYFHANSTLPDSQATGAESVAIGGNAQSLATNSVALGSNSVADRANTVSVGSAGNERQITNVAAGTADTDAVNVAQLKASGIINPNGTTNAAVTYDHNADGTTNYSSITMGNGAAGGTTIHNVAAGTSGDDAVNVDQMNSAISTVTNIAHAANNPMFAADGNRDTEAAVASGTHSTAMGANASATAANSVALGANSVADRANSVSVGAAGNERQVTNVAAGTATTDAVNVGQLNDAIGSAVGNLPAGMTSKAYTDQQINSVQNSVSQVAKNAYAGVAAATALTMIPDVDQGKTIAVGIGGGSYKGSQAVALGVSARITENLKMKAGAGTSSQGTAIGIGASYQW
ncbi:YadA-like family protein [Paraburkholderia graminis]